MKRIASSRSWVAVAALLAALAYATLGEDGRPESRPDPATGTDSAAILELYDERRSGVVVEGTGVVDRVLGAICGFLGGVRGLLGRVLLGSASGQAEGAESDGGEEELLHGGGGVGESVVGSGPSAPSLAQSTKRPRRHSPRFLAQPPLSSRP